jgi:DDE superfamily endonuclease/Helix-turn-helix of DDE superfamily endonuclease
MLIYNELKNKPREFLAATGLKLDEFEQLLPAFQTAYGKKYPPNLTQAGKTRQRQIGGGATGALPQIADKLFFILVYQKTNPLQTMHGLHFGLRQPQTNAWIHRLLPILQQALRTLGEAPERDARRVATSDLARAGGPNLTIDGSERRRQRPQDHTKQKAHYSGKKKAHTDKNILLVNANTKKVVYLSPTVAGKTHDKKATDEAQIGYPHNATLDKDTGFQGYEPAGTQTRQPKKSPKAKN